MTDSLGWLLISVTAGLMVFDSIAWKRDRSRREKILLPGYLVVTGIYFLIQTTPFLFLPSSAEFYQLFANSLGHGSVSSYVELNWLSYTLMGVILATTFYLSGLVDYLVHRKFSHSRSFWFTHEYHHLPKVVAVWSPGILVRPFSVLTVVPVMLSTFFIYGVLWQLFRLPADFFVLIYLVFALQLFLLITSHSLFLRTCPKINRVLNQICLTSPQDHYLHHSTKFHRNYGNFTTLWDRVFGTYVNSNKVSPREITSGLPYNQDFLGAITANYLHLPANFRKFFSVTTWCNWKD